MASTFLPENTFNFAPKSAVVEKVFTDLHSRADNKGVRLVNELPAMTAKADVNRVDQVLANLGRSDNPLFELALRLEEIALHDEYFVARKLYPNVDFYSGIIYSALGIPRSMFTVMFAIARTAGWVAHWQEMISDPTMKIGRPRQLYTGPTTRDYVDIGAR